MLRGSVSVVELCDANVLSLGLGPNQVYDYRYVVYREYGKGNYISCPSMCISLVRSTRGDSPNLVISKQNTITPIAPSKCKGLYGNRIE